METIGDLLTRDLSQRIEEVIQVDQADEQSVYSEMSEYVATTVSGTSTPLLLKAIAEAPAEPHESHRRLDLGLLRLRAKVRSPRTSAMR